MDLVLTTFDGSLWETMRLMQSTDLFMGMHGAGFTNTLFLPKVRPGRTDPLASCGFTRRRHCCVVRMHHSIWNILVLLAVRRADIVSSVMSLALLQGSTVIQLFPYGWQKPGNGEVLREVLYSNMVAATNSSYYRWVNDHREKAFLRKYGGWATSAQPSQRLNLPVLPVLPAWMTIRTALPAAV